MSEHSAIISWQRQNNEIFCDNKYNRSHQWSFDGGTIINASPSPEVVPPPYSDATKVDPEEAFVASLSSCHMLFFLAIAAKRGLVVDEYTDKASGLMAKNDAGKTVMTTVTLRPRVVCSGNQQPDDSDIKTIHHQAHQQCFIANSVITKIIIEPC